MKLANRYFLLRVLKFVAFIVSCIYIFYHINNRFFLLDSGERIRSVFSNRTDQFRVTICFLLMMINWSLEVWKWKRLLRPVEPISFIKAARSVLTGITISFFTPNRVGEFAGRIVHLDEGYRIRGMLSAFIGSSAQLLITVQAGLIAAAFGLMEYYPFGNTLLYLLKFILFSAVIILFILWVKIPEISVVFERISFLKKFREYGMVFSRYHFSDLLHTYRFSLLRYLVFCSQQYILFQVFHVDIGYLICLKLSALSFLIITIVPSIAFGELGIRGGINLAIFGTVVHDSSAILLVTFSLWTINLALPALMGAVAMLYIRISRD